MEKEANGGRLKALRSGELGTTSSGNEEREIKASLEKKISEMSLDLQKLERDLSFKDEELRNMRKYAEEAAKTVEPLRLKI